MKCFDLLDERALRPLEIRDVVQTLFGENVPHPDEDWAHFSRAVANLCAASPQEFNFVSNRLEPW